MSRWDDKKCANCPAKLSHYAPRFKFYFFFQSRGIQPREKSESRFVDLCPDCLEALRKGKKPSPGLWRAVQKELLVQAKTVAPGTTWAARYQQSAASDDINGRLQDDIKKTSGVRP